MKFPLKYKLLALLLLLMCFCELKAQLHSISGKIEDIRNREALELVSVRILNQSDSSYISGTVSDEKGEFKIQAKPALYILHLSSFGYKSLYRNVDIRKENASLGIISLSENAILLQEAIVTAKAVEIIAKEDTLEYNAAAYKTQETAVIEELLQKMPGVMIDENGIVTVNGREVKKFLINGKEFFTDDPKIALKNLPAKIVDKLQVIDQKSEMSQLTGFADGEEETVINLTIKPEMMKNTFGDITLGYGSQDKYGLRGMVNYMDDKAQLSAFIGTNNTNNIGFSDSASDIYAGNRPAGGMNFGGNNGVTKSLSSGLTFSKEYTKTRKWSGDISYGQGSNDVTTQRSREYIGADRTNTALSVGTNKNKNLKANLRFEWDFNKKTRIIFRPRLQYSTNNNNQSSDSYNVLTSDTLKNSKNQNRNSSDGDRHLLSGVLTISHRFTKKGRNITTSITGTINNTNREGFTYTETTYANPSRKKNLTDRFYTQEDKSPEWRVNLSYTEPLPRNNFLQFRYIVHNKSSNTDKIVYDKDDDNNEYSTIVDNSTRKMKNDFLNQNLTINFRSVRKKFNYVVGVGVEPSSSKTSVELPTKTIARGEAPRKNFISFSPNVEFNYIWNKRHNLKIEYRSRTIQATTLQLYDGVISQSATDSLRGNPNLKPKLQSNFALRYQKFNPDRASMLIIRGELIHLKNDIVMISSWEDTKQFRTYENIDGNINTNLRVIYNTPFARRKLSFNTNTYLAYISRNTYINAEKQPTASKNEGNTYEFRENIGIRYNSDLLDVDLRGHIRYRNTKNSLSKDSDREVVNYGGYANVTFYLPYNILISSDMQYTANAGYEKQFNQKEWLWNFTMAKEMFKKKNGIIRLNVYDILQQRSNITQQATAQYIEYASTNTIRSYVMVNFVYKFNATNK